MSRYLRRFFGPIPRHDVAFGYDQLNRVTNMVDAVGTTKYAYAAGGQLWTEDGPFSNDTVTNTYFNRLRVGLVLQQPAGVWTNGFWYDAAKRMTNVASPAGTFSYTLGGTCAGSPLVKKLLLPNTSYITNTYDEVARLTGTYLKKSDHSTLNKHDYTYNVGNQRTLQTYSDSSTVAYQYDPIGQVTNADSSVSVQDRKYLYAHANPVMMTDPSGHFSMPELGSVMTKISGLAARVGVSIARSPAAAWLRGQFTSTKMAQRAAIGALVAGTLNNYTEFYIPPTVDELTLLSNEMMPLPNLPDGRNPSAEVMKLAVLGSDLNEQLAAGNVSGPLRAQLPPYNWVRSGLMGYEALSYIAHVQQSVATMGRAFGYDVKLDVSETQIIWYALLRNLDPDGDVRTIRQAVAAYNQKDMLTLATTMAELEKRLGKYGTVTIAPLQQGQPGQ